MNRFVVVRKPCRKKDKPLNKEENHSFEFSIKKDDLKTGVTEQKIKKFLEETLKKKYENKKDIGTFIVPVISNDDIFKINVTFVYKYNSSDEDKDDAKFKKAISELELVLKAKLKAEFPV